MERFNLTLTDARPHEYDSSRADVLERWLHDYNYYRPIIARVGRPPVSAVNNFPGSTTSR
jgi:hypothetical protein